MRLQGTPREGEGNREVEYTGSEAAKEYGQYHTAAARNSLHEGELALRASGCYYDWTSGRVDQPNNPNHPNTLIIQITIINLPSQ